MDKTEIEDTVLHLIREYECVPRLVFFQLFKGENENANQKKRKFLRRCLGRLTRERYIDYKLKQDVYCIPTFDGKVSELLVKALWIMIQFDNVRENYAGSHGILIVFTRDNDNSLYEIVHLSSKTYRMTVEAINRDTEAGNMPKRIVIVDDDEEADRISDNTLKEVNCIALCSVSDDGSIESYDF